MRGILAVRPRGVGFPRWGGLCATHYYDMHTSRGDMCLGVWGYGDMYVIIALSRVCQSMNGLMKGKHAQKKVGAVGAMPPNPLSLKTRGLGGGSHTRSPPPPPGPLPSGTIGGMFLEKWGHLQSAEDPTSQEVPRPTHCTAPAISPNTRTLGHTIESPWNTRNVARNMSRSEFCVSNRYFSLSPTTNTKPLLECAADSTYNDESQACSRP